MNPQTFFEKLGCSWKRNVPLSRYASWRIGGPADWLVEPYDLNQLSAVLRFCQAQGFPLLVMGHGTNLLFDDTGLRGVALRIADKMADYEIAGNRICAQAGLWTPKLARIALEAHLGGLEHIVGIPGTLGGLVAMNGGSLRRFIGQHIVSVRAVARSDGSMHDISAEQCAFAYRTSRFQKGSLVVGQVDLECPKRDVQQIRRDMLAILRNRRGKFPRKAPNSGSVFLSNGELYDRFGPPGKVIEETGLRGLRIGDAEVSVRHANFIVNQGNASSRDVLALIARVRQSVHARTGLWMQSEVRYVSPEGNICPASEALPQTR